LVNFVCNGLFVVELGIRCALPLKPEFWNVMCATTRTVNFILIVSTGYCSLFVLWWRPFFSQPWKIFDLLIVVSSLLALTPWVSIPSEVRMLNVCIAA
jgi:hypothetical protein